MKPLDPSVIAAAQASQAKWGVPASVSLAQYGLESGWGKHEPPGSNNPFGIKAKGGEPFVVVTTHEFVHGKMITTSAAFVKFSSLEDAFNHHAELIATAPIYASAMKLLPSLEAFVAEMGKHYATDPNYALKLLGVIHIDGLEKYDGVTH